ncbi:MAG TPA: hypothetical protein VF181_07355 [Balneolaceae bacterium]
MKKAVSLLILAAFLTSCDSGSVDQNYVKSGKYEEFERKSRQEAIRKDKQKRSFAAHMQALGNCKQSEAHFPLKISRKQIASLLKTSAEDCEQLMVADRLGFEIQLLKEIQLPSYTLKWVLLDQKSVYDNRRLLAVTFRNDSLVNFEEVGVFQKNLSKDINTTIEVTKKGEKLLIESEINRKIIYPVEQKNVINRRFTINPKGIIE